VTIEEWAVGSFTIDDALHYIPGDESGGMWWPAGDRHVPHSGLRYRLASSARWHARTALNRFVSDDVDDQLQAAISAGIAVELIFKAYIANIAPQLLAEKGQIQSVLMLSGRGDLSGKTAHDLRSISGLQVVDTARQLIAKEKIGSSFPHLPQNLQCFIARNSACHMAIVEADQLRHAVIEMTKIVDGMLPLMGLVRERFWGPGVLSAADALVNQANDEVRQRFEAKMAAARREVHRLTSALTPAKARRLLATLAQRPIPGVGPDDYEERRPCPACGQDATVQCYVISAMDLGSDAPGRIAYPALFRCAACKLTLNNEELALIGIPDTIDLDQDKAALEYFDGVSGE
jgi:hypothetical protein